MFKVRNLQGEVFTVYAVKPVKNSIQTRITTGTAFLIYDNCWKWVNAYDYFPVEEKANESKCTEV